MSDVDDGVSIFVLEVIYAFFLLSTFRVGPFTHYNFIITI